MKSMVRSGLVLLVVLTLLWVFTPAPTVRLELSEHKPLIPVVKTKATMEEKRENIRVSKRYAYILYKWGKREQACLVSLWTSESRFDHYAINKQGSSAYGIAQLLGEKDNRPEYQILRGLKYISKRYETPCKAHKFFLKHRYY